MPDARGRVGDFAGNEAETVCSRIGFDLLMIAPVHALIAGSIRTVIRQLKN